MSKLLASLLVTFTAFSAQAAVYYCGGKDIVISHTMNGTVSNLIVACADKWRVSHPTNDRTDSGFMLSMLTTAKIHNLNLTLEDTTYYGKSYIKTISIK